MNVKGLQNECSVLHENLNSESEYVEGRSKISVSGTGVCTQKGAHIPTPAPTLLQILSRPAFHLPHVVKTQSWSLVSGGLWLKRAQRPLVEIPKSESGNKLQLQHPAAGSPVLPFQWGQWPLPHPAAAPYCKAGCLHLAATHMAHHILPCSLNPKPVNQQKETN